MFNWFFKKKPENTNEIITFSDLRVDVHSHFIPGIDDGSPDIATSMLLIKKMSELGYQKIITTPHVMSDLYKNNSKNILEGLKMLKKEILIQKIDIEILAAAEYYIDYAFVEKIGKEDFLTFGDNYLLIELSFVDPPKELFNIIFQLQLEGYKVVLAHPERYSYYDMHNYRQLIDKGVFFQLNLLSLIDYYPGIVKKKAKDLINADMVNFLGTDCHNIHQASLYKKSKKTVAFKKLVQNSNLLNNTL